MSQVRKIREELGILHEAGASNFGIQNRILRFSEYFLGKPYRSDPLLGSADLPEVFVCDSDSFDCVTFVETVLALAFSEIPQDIPQHLRQLRYLHGKVDWWKRNHYSIDWIERNEKASYVRQLRFGDEIQVQRDLHCLGEYPSCERELSFLPPEAFSKVCPKELRSGDLVFFGTERSNLDVSHLGFLLLSESGILLRHASRQKGRVVDEPLSEFLERFGGTPGFWIVRAEEFSPRLS